VADTEWAERKRQEETKGTLAYKPQRNRIVPESLRAYAFFASSADKGAVRAVPDRNL
jgi:dihydroxy-acid dehydratase